MGCKESTPPLAGIMASGLMVAVCAVALGGPPKDPAKHTNRLAKETSPYLLLHAHNPVDWHPWGPEAFSKAKAEKKPIFLSVGYSSCYWCHVMERECFMDEAIAKVMNEKFVCVKVDREERPDVDQIYMTALQAFGNGGWPMSMFLTPEGKPFFGGTYFPPKDREEMPGFPTILEKVAEAWRDHRPELEKDADRLAARVRLATASADAQRRTPLSRAMTVEGRSQLAEQFDPDFGGFGFDPDRPRRPKFPEPVNLIFLLDQHQRDQAGKKSGKGAGEGAKPGPLAMVLKTMDHMARGGIRDHLGGGYHRYSTDRSWTVPHFEKMLYDNAQLASAHVLAYEATADPRWRREAEATFDFVARSMTDPEGGFHSALDAETNGEEGRYYVWTRDEVERRLGAEDFPAFALVYGLADRPNFEKDLQILLEPKPLADRAKALKTSAEALEGRLAPLRLKLLAARERRPAPSLDDKVLTSWNGLMIAAYADGFRVLKEPRYRRAAEKAADFLLARLRTAEGRLLRTYRAGKAKLPAYLEDYAFLVHGLLRLHAATGDPERLAQAKALTDRMIDDFADKTRGGFFYTSEDHESLLARTKDPFDNALPSGNSVAIRNLIALSAATREPRYLEAAGKALDAFSPALSRSPGGLPLMLVAVEEYLDARPPDASSSPAKDQPDQLPGGMLILSGKATVVDPAAIAPGLEFDVKLTLEVKEGWHVYANPTGADTAKPTTIALKSEQAITLVRVDYPEGETKALAGAGSEKVAVYEGKTNVTARVRVEKDARAGRAVLNFKVRHQACNEKVCLAPTVLTVPLEVSIVP